MPKNTWSYLYFLLLFVSAVCVWRSFFKTKHRHDRMPFPPSIGVFCMLLPHPLPSDVLSYSLGVTKDFFFTFYVLLTNAFVQFRMLTVLVRCIIVIGVYIMPSCTIMPGNRMCKLCVWRFRTEMRDDNLLDHCPTKPTSFLIRFRRSMCCMYIFSNGPTPRTMGTLLLRYPCPQFPPYAMATTVEEVVGFSCKSTKIILREFSVFF